MHPIEMRVKWIFSRFVALFYEFVKKEHASYNLDDTRKDFTCLYAYRHQFISLPAGNPFDHQLHFLMRSNT